MRARGRFARKVGERVDAAKDILIRTDRPVDEIAEAVGFGSSHALRHHFRRMVKLSPSDYRGQFSNLPFRQ